VFSLLAGPPTPANPPVGRTGRYPLPDGIGINYYTWPLNAYRIPEVYFWNFTVQHQITSTTAIEVAYVGNVGRHLFLFLNENQAVPGPGSDFSLRRPFFPSYGLTQTIGQVCNCDNSNYNAIQTKLQKQFSHGLDLLLTYTWSKALGNSENAGGFSDNYNVRASYGPMSWDRTHTVTFEHNWDLPFGHNRHWTLGNNIVADTVLGGWRLSGVHNFGSGLPFTPTVSNAPLLNADFNNVRADVIKNPSVSNPSAGLWFNPTAFTGPEQPFRNGTAGRNSLRGPALAVSNLSLSKNLIPSEHWSPDLRADAFNVFNHVNLGLPNSTIDQGNAGQITSVQIPMRQMQFGLHLQF
jgi:hypothetical protein